MKARINTCIVLAAFTLGGCATNGYRTQVREDANNRLDAINATLNFEQAESAFAVGHFEKASHQIELAIARYPEQASWYVLKARILIEMHRLEGAASALQSALVIDPELAEAHYYAGIVQQRWSNDQSAYDHYSAAFEAENENVQYLLAAAESLVAIQQFEEARSLVDTWIVYFEHNSALRHLLAQISLLEGDAETSVELYTEARRLSPDDDALLEELARAQFAAGQYGKCYGSVLQLLRFSEDVRPDLMLIESRCLSLMGRSSEARTAYLNLTAVDPTNTDAWIELGALAWELNDFKNVALGGARASQLAPNQPEGFLLKAVNELHHGRTAKAETLLQQAAGRAPTLALPHLMLGQLYQESGEFNQALDAYAAAMQADPDSREAVVLHNKLNAEFEVWAAEGTSNPLD